MTAFFRGDQRPSAGADEPVVLTEDGAIEVLECNWVAVQTYLRCAWTVVGGMAIVWLGISATEVSSAMRIQRVPIAAWADTQDRVKVMVGIIKPMRNKPKGK